jgi:hypothetical protein
MRTQVFAGVAVVLEAADLRDGVEWNRSLERFLFVRLPGEIRLRAFDEVFRSLNPRPTHCLVGADDDALHLGRVMQRLESHHHLGRAAVRTGDNPSRVERILGVDFRDHERHIRFHAEIARLVNHFAARGEC